MLAHFIHYKGKGGWVIVMPLLIGVVLFIIADLLSINDRYNGPAALILSGVILFILDIKHKKTTEGEIIQRVIKLPRVKNKNTFIWIEMRFWGMFLFAIGVIWLLNL